jgi:hypothetical protein
VTLTACTDVAATEPVLVSVVLMGFFAAKIVLVLSSKTWTEVAPVRAVILVNIAGDVELMSKAGVDFKGHIVVPLSSLLEAVEVSVDIIW